MELQIRGWAATDVGQRRSRNEDRFFRDPDRGVFAVADGIGGKPGGAKASELVVRQIDERAEDIRRFVDRRDAPLEACGRDEIFEFLTDAVQAINQRVYSQRDSSKFPRGIGSTLDLVVLASGGAFVLHVGDSRVYLLRGEQIYRITRDHTYEQQLRDNHRGDPREQHPEKYGHVLTRSMGGRPRVTADRLFVDLRPGDRLLLCTDGVTRHLTGSDILTLSGECDDEMVPQRLIDEANDRGGLDNSTAVLVSVDRGGEEAPESADFARAPTQPDTFRRVRFLESVMLFSELEFQELLKVLRFVRTRHAPKGEVIISRGDPVDGLYFVMEGQLTVELNQKRLTTLNAGDHFGEFALFGQPVRSADVKAEESSELLFISKGNFEKLVDETPDVGTKLLWQLLARSSQIIQEMLAEQ